MRAARHQWDASPDDPTTPGRHETPCTRRPCAGYSLAPRAPTLCHAYASSMRTLETELAVARGHDTSSARRRRAHAGGGQRFRVLSKNGTSGAPRFCVPRDEGYLPLCADSRLSPSGLGWFREEPRSGSPCSVPAVDRGLVRWPRMEGPGRGPVASVPAFASLPAGGVDGVLNCLTVASVVARSRCAERLAAVLRGIRRAADRVADDALVVLGGARLDALRTGYLDWSRRDGRPGGGTAWWVRCPPGMRAPVAQRGRRERRDVTYFKLLFIYSGGRSPVRASRDVPRRRGAPRHCPFPCGGATPRPVTASCAEESSRPLRRRSCCGLTSSSDPLEWRRLGSRRQTKAAR
jgi:hypothetical protein